MKMNRRLLLPFFLVAGIGSTCEGADSAPQTLVAARHNFHTKLLPQKREMEPVEVAPRNIFSTIKYPSANVQLAAYLTRDPADGKKHPAIIWITGGDCNSIGDVWSDAPRDNDQTAAAYRKAGIVMMFPSLRGGNDNRGAKEGFLGEVDDVIAAAKFLQKQSYVDSNCIYLGGHSTGATLALLVSECSSLFRAVFVFGAVENVAGYGAESGFVPVDFKNRQEIRMRSPGYWLSSIQSPTWVLEGTEKRSNIESLRTMSKVSTNPKARFVEIKNADHFSVLAPINELIARQILNDTNAECNINLSAEAVNRHFAASLKSNP
jgi:dipeptidyl aminopeptidase/acylaminoacyl peptidase